MKKFPVVGIALAVTMLAATSCGNDENARVAGLATDSICLANDTFASMMGSGAAEMSADQITAKRAEVEGKLKDMPKQYGFADDKSVETAFANITDKAAFRKDVTAKVKAKCNASDEVLNGALDSMLSASASSDANMNADMPAATTTNTNMN